MKVRMQNLAESIHLQNWTWVWEQGSPHEEITENMVSEVSHLQYWIFKLSRQQEWSENR